MSRPGTRTSALLAGNVLAIAEYERMATGGRRWPESQIHLFWRRAHGLSFLKDCPAPQEVSSRDRRLGPNTPKITGAVHRPQR